MDADLVVRNGIVVTASDIWPESDIVIKDGVIVAIGYDLNLKSSIREIDAQGAYVTPGGIDSHVHLSQWWNPGPDEPQKTIPTDGNIPNLDKYTGDTYETGSRSAIAGGTTTILSFALQFQEDESIIPVIEEYHKLASGQSYCDYSFHVILTNPTKRVLEEDLPVMVEQYGITSIKIYMTYTSLRLNDYQTLDVLLSARKLGITTMVHAENADVVEWITDQLEKKGMNAPHYHGASRPPLAEAEATNRVISLSELMGTPILLVHVSSELAATTIRNAQTRLIPIHAETCPHYLYLMADKMRAKGFEGAKWVCSPPLREDSADINAIWRGLRNGTFTTISSDHAPDSYHHPNGKQRCLADDNLPYGKFKDIPNGLPGLETRMPLLFEGVLDGKITPQKFVELTASNPAKLYGLKRKGVIAPGFDADITIWYPEGGIKPFRLSNEMLHHRIDYTPYEQMEFKNWARYTILRGKVVFQEGKLLGSVNDGKFVKRGSSSLSGPSVLTSEWQP